MKPLDKGLWFALALTLLAMWQRGGGESPFVPGPVPSPIATDGLAVLVIYESTKLDDLSKEQAAILTGTGWRKIVADAGGQLRVFDRDADFVDAGSIWKPPIDAGGDVPRIVVSHRPRGGHVGPLPADNAAMTALVKEWIE